MVKSETRPAIQKGRGTSQNPPNRFERIHYEPSPGSPSEERTRTEFYRDPTRRILSHNDSPDIPFDFSLNPYRGCEHGCIYCYARPTHEYLGFSAGLDFETRILIKESAPDLLRQELMSPGWKPQPVALCGVTDPYQPVERQLQITRKCLEVLTEFRNPVTIVTKNHLVTRDIDLLSGLAQHQAVVVNISMTTLNRELHLKMEPRTSSPDKRLQAMWALTDAGIPVRVLLAPVIPGLTDHEIPQILRKAAGTGTRFAGYLMLRLPLGVKELFQDWLENHCPGSMDKVLNRISEIRNGRLNDPEYFCRMSGKGTYAQQVKDLFRVASQKFGLSEEDIELSTTAFSRPGGQLRLFSHG